VAVAKHLMVRAFEEVEHFHGEDITATVEDMGVLRIKEKGEEGCLGIFYRWEYVRNLDNSQN